MVKIAFLLYEDIAALDVVGPYEVLARLPGAQVSFVATTPRAIRSDVGLALVADSPLEAVPAADIVVVPGGPGVKRARENDVLLRWLRQVHESTRWTTSVCTGSLLLGAAGLLAGKRATSHWMDRERLRAFGAEPVAERVVVDGKVITAAGVSSGIDMALVLAAREAGEEAAQMLQLVVEYDPQPPFNCGSLEKATDAIRERAMRYFGVATASRQSAEMD